jgi:PAS domain S-box-containing protein
MNAEGIKELLLIFDRLSVPACILHDNKIRSFNKQFEKASTIVELSGSSVNSVLQDLDLYEHQKQAIPVKFRGSEIYYSLFRCAFEDAEIHVLFPPESIPEKEIFLKTIIEGISDAFVSLDSNWVFTYVNKRAAEIFGRKPEEITGKKIWEEFPGGNGRKFFHEYLKVKHHNKARTIEEYYAPWDKWFENRITPFNGGLLIFFQDITDRKENEINLKRINNVLTESQKLVDMATWEWDLKKNQIWWSDLLYQIIGVDKNKFVPSLFSFVRLVHPDDQDKLRYGLKHTMHEDRAVRIDFRIIHPGGSISYYKSIAQLYTDHLGNREKVIGVVSDITEFETSRNAVLEFNRTLEKQVHDRTRSLIEAQSQLKALIENTRDGIWSLDQDYCLTSFNRSFNKSYKILTGYDLNSGMKLSEILDPVGYSGYYNFWKAMTDRAIKGERFVEEFNITLAGKEIIYLVSCSPIIIENKINGVTFFSKDITERKRSEKAIVSLNEVLTNKVNELEETNKDLNAFSYSVSHDLRAPIRAISGITEMISRRIDKTADAEVMQLLERIKHNILRMDALIQDLLEFSKIGKKDIKKTEINMNELVAAIIQEFKTKMEIEKTEFHVTELHPCKADYSLIIQVLINLISNAIKYSGKAEHPIVEISSSIADKEVIYCIKDNGVGFDMKYYGKLFDVFCRLHSDSEFEGTGVGLAIVKRIISKHDGRVWAEAEQGKGASFFFSLPV